jgi:endonuclease III
MNNRKITKRLVEHGQALYDAPHKPVKFTDNDDANILINDIEKQPHAFVLASIMDRQIKAERAWIIPYRIQQRLGSFSMEKLLDQSRTDIRDLMAKPEPLHRFVENMADSFYKALQRIHRCYDSDASRIWADKPASATVIYHLLQFDGIGPKIATMAANILARDFKVPMSDHYSIDISADVHIRRVFSRLSLCTKDSSVQQVVYKARALYPEFPGLMDLPCWQIGRNWCGPKKQKCEECYMSDLCPSEHISE